MLYSNIKNKMVVSISTANELGVVKGVYIEKATKSPIYLGVNGENGINVLKIKDVFCYNDIITVLRDEMVAPLQEAEQYILIDIGAEIYDVKAFRIGALSDIKLTPTSPNACLISQDCAVKMLKIVGLQSKLIMVNTQRKQLQKRLSAPQTMVLQKAEEPLALSASQPENIAPPTAYQDSNTPKERVISNYNFLLGRRVLRDIVGINQELLVRKDTIITPRLIAQAKQIGKLIDLSLNSK